MCGDAIGAWSSQEKWTREPELDKPAHRYTAFAVRRLRRTAVASVLDILITGLFWAANSFALAFGAGRGYQDALVFTEKPEVIVDVRQRLPSVPADVAEIDLGRQRDQQFRYRYHNLRLLIESHRGGPEMA